MDSRKLTSSDVSPPGLKIQEMLRARGVQQADFAAVVGVSEKQVSRILSGKAPLTLDFALKLEHYFGNPDASEWLTREAQYRLSLVAKSQKDELRWVEIRRNIYEHMPVREMVSLGWIPDPGRSMERLLELAREFWGRPGKGPLDFGFLDGSPAMMMRSSDAYQAKFNPYYAATWLRKARLVSEVTPVVMPFDRAAVLSLAEDIPAYSNRPDGESAMLSRLRENGVSCVELKHLPKTYLDGAAFLSNGHPSVVFTRRLDRIDNFWFVLAHELAHVCLHLKPEGKESDIFVDCEKGREGDRENEADDLAGRWLLHPVILDHFRHRFIRDADVLAFAREKNIHPGIVVGCLQHHGYLSYARMNEWKMRETSKSDKTSSQHHKSRTASTRKGRPRIRTD